MTEVERIQIEMKEASGDDVERMSNIQYNYDKCPHTRKIHLVEWAMKRFDITESKANSYNKKQLYAIWYREKEKSNGTYTRQTQSNQRESQ